MSRSKAAIIHTASPIRSPSLPPALLRDLAAALFRNDEHRGPRRHSILKVGPARRRSLIGCRNATFGGRNAIFGLARVLDREEQRLVVGREERSAELGSNRNAEEVL